MQSEPVSPPPMTMTCLSFAEITSSAPCTPWTHLVLALRKSMAKWIPWRSLPGTGRSRGFSEPPVSTTASNSSIRRVAGTSTPTWELVRNSTPSARIWAMRRSIRVLSSLKSGMPYRSSPPMRSSFSRITTAWPARASCCAHAMPAGPDPTTATRLPVLWAAILGLIQPSSQARSTMAHSMVLMVTGTSSMLRVHEASQGAGQILPVNSGKLLVEWSTSIADCQSWWYTRSFQSGMRLFTGHPW